MRRKCHIFHAFGVGCLNAETTFVGGGYITEYHPVSEITYYIHRTRCGAN